MSNNSYLGNIRIVSIILMETGTMNPMLGRSLQTHVAGDVENALADVTRYGTYINPNAVAGVAGQIVVPGEVDRLINIDGGWMEKRYRFVMYAEPENSSFASAIVNVYTGYTNGAAMVQLPNGGYDFPPEMRFYINNCVTISKAPTITPTGETTALHTIQNASHFIHQQTMGGNMQAYFDQNTLQPTTIPSMIRPADVMHSIASKTRSMFDQQPEVDLRTAIQTSLSKRTNAIPANYLTQNLQAIARASIDDMYNMNGVGMYENAAGIVQDPTPFREPIVAKLMATGSNISAAGYTTWSEMKNSFPELHAQGVVKMVRRQDAQRQDVYQTNAGDYQPWYQSNPTGSVSVNQSMEAVVANSLMNTVPSVMLECLLVRTRITATNMVIGGGIEINIEPPYTITPLPQHTTIQMVELLRQRLELQILRDLPINTAMPFNLIMHIDVFGESHIYVGINGQPPVPFCVPSYSDAMFTPMVTTQNTTLTNIANDIEYLAGRLQLGV